MVWLKTILSARWFPYALVGIPALLALVSGWGYLKGYGAAELEMTEKMNTALAAQLKAERSTARKRLVIAVRQAERTSNVTQNIKAVHRPGGCQWPPECVRAFNDGVRGANTGTAAADTAVGAPARGD